MNTNTQMDAVEQKMQAVHEYLRMVFNAQLKHRDDKVLFNAFNKQYIQCYAEFEDHK